MPTPQLSLCLIFRDEEAMLPGFLESVAGLWDEFVAVDTGSRDRSAELLAAAGARIVEFPWCDDFAAARNASLESASGRWILFLDADERPTPQLKREILALIEEPRAGAATVVMRNNLPGGHRRDSRLLRLFRNRPDVRFRYRIHEDVAHDVQAMLERENLQLRHLDGMVEHLGYVREVAADRNKKDRDLALLHMSLEQDPDDFYCRFKVLEIARFWADQDLWCQEARECSRRLEQLTPELATGLKARPWSGELAVLVAQGLGLDPRQQLAWLDSQLAWIHESAAWRLHRGTLFEAGGDLDSAEREYRRCRDLPDEAATQLTGARPLLGLCRLALARQDPQKAEKLAVEAGQLAPVDEEALLALAVCSRLDPGRPPLKDHLAGFPGAALPAGRVLLSHGQARHAWQILTPNPADDPAPADRALGALVCGLACGEHFTGDIDTDQETADRLLKGWVSLLWTSRDTEAMAGFAERCQAITGVFPWLPAFLESETKRLREETP